MTQEIKHITLKISRVMQSPYRLQVFGIVLVILYNNWLIAPVFNRLVSTRYTLISEISARSQPYHWLFQLLDITAGLVTLASLPLVVRYLRRVKTTHMGLLVFGFGFVGLDSIIDASLPISCAPSISTQCGLLTTNSVLTSAHMIESSIAGVAVFAVPFVWWYINRRRRHKLIRLNASFALVQILVGVGILAGRFMHHDVSGIMQRIYELGIGCWTAGVVYFSVHKRARSIEVELPVLNSVLLEE